ncbi:hypothetical protein KSX_77420 [Ktedonospora formicarum]|uniref:Uncharacterized protein n=1 Tax=Ktedonospora formicarum TaxID=2778364 RepID=A0A8J3ICH5_9CHLR|nr:hypothetical protein KSX_77420 [Ktedonospora formicarum]
MRKEDIKQCMSLKGKFREAFNSKILYSNIMIDVPVSEQYFQITGGEPLEE